MESVNQELVSSSLHWACSIHFLLAFCCVPTLHALRESPPRRILVFTLWLGGAILAQPTGVHLGCLLRGDRLIRTMETGRGYDIEEAVARLRQ